jgi:undecaprenyl-diphosphatase
VHPISYAQAIVLGLLQGASELFPISSLGHSVLLPRLLGWNIQSGDDSFLTFLVATHLATALVLLGFFWKDWVRIVKALWRSVTNRRIDRDDPDERLAWLLVVGTVPAGILGLALEHKLRSVFGSPTAVSIFLALNGVMLLGAERLRRRAPTPERTRSAEEADARLARRLSFRGATGIGFAQALALLPGFSRSGAAMSGGLLAGLNNEDAARFAFLLATPIIGAAGLLKLPHLFGPEGDGVRGPALVGAICAAISAYLAVRFLVRYFAHGRLTGFGIYCLAAGAIVTGVFLAGG